MLITPQFFTDSFDVLHSSSSAASEQLHALELQSNRALSPLDGDADLGIFRAAQRVHQFTERIMIHCPPIEPRDFITDLNALFVSRRAIDHARNVEVTVAQFGQHT